MLTIKDLSVNEELDRKALAAVHGGNGDQMNIGHQLQNIANLGLGAAVGVQTLIQINIDPDVLDVDTYAYPVYHPAPTY